jgi:hypothetical protein
MGQPITVVEKPSSNPAVVRFETNRPLSGMGHERYTGPPSELLVRPVDELARRLFAAGGVEGVHINGSVVTVTLGGGRTGTGLADVVRSLFRHYPDQPGAPAAAAPQDAGAVAEAEAEAETPRQPEPAQPSEAAEAADETDAADEAEAADEGEGQEEPGEAGFGRDADGEAQPDEPPASEQVVPDPEPTADAGASTEEPPAPG